MVVLEVSGFGGDTLGAAMGALLLQPAANRQQTNNLSRM
jgi:hypothetical protein